MYARPTLKFHPGPLSISDNSSDDEFRLQKKRSIPAGWSATLSYRAAQFALLVCTIGADVRTGELSVVGELLPVFQLALPADFAEAFCCGW